MSHGASNLHAELQREPSLPVGESLFTQEENEREQVQSLREFEQLEHLSLGKSGDHVNLIGAYLKGMENQEMMEDPGMQEFGEERFDEYNEHYEGSMKSRKHDREVRSHPDQRDLHDSNPLDDSTIENEIPPFGFGDSINFSSLDMSANYEMFKTVASDELPSKIPMLRNRSQSMSRPGSSSSKPRSRPSSRSEIRSQNGRQSRERRPHKSPERRSLPATPQMSDSSRSNSQDRASRNSSIVRVSRSPDGVLRRSPSQSPNQSPTRLLPALNSEQLRKDASDYDETDNALHQAAELLLHGSNADYFDTSRSKNRSGHSTPKDGQSTKSSPRNKTQTAKQNSTSSPQRNSNRTRQRPFSAEVTRPVNRKPPLSSSRPATPNNFRIRSNSTNGTGPKPVKAKHAISESVDATRSSTDMEESEDTSITGSKFKNELKKKFLSEKNERKMKEQTLKQLQQEYHNLLQKYAEAENTIDSLRIGAKIPIAIELTTIGGQGQGQGERRMSVVSTGLPPTNVGSVVSLASASGLVGIQGSKQGSRPASSVSVTSARNPKVMVPFEGQEVVAMGSGSSDADAAKLNLLAEAKHVQEQTKAFEALMREERLSLAEQEQVLVNVKSGYEALQQNFRDAKDEFMLKKRQRRGSNVSSESGFDDDKTVEGELYKLGMKLDELEHSVQENLKEKNAMRKPFQGPAPVKGDHGVVGSSVGSGAPSGLHREYGSIASSKGGSSTSMTGNSEQYYQSGSFPGSSNEIEDKLNQVEQEYTNLMDSYHRLKQLKQTPERDIHTNDLLDTLRGIYHNAPARLRLPPPPDSPSRGQSPENSEDMTAYQQDTAKMEEVGGPYSDVNSDRTKGYSSSMAGSDRQSDRRSDRMPARYSNRPSARQLGKYSDRPSGRHSDQMSARLSDRLSANERPSGRRSSGGSKPRKQSEQDRQLQDQASSYGSASESVESAILSRKPGTPSQSGRRGSVPVRKRDAVDRDSGYIGSEISRKTLDSPDKSRQTLYVNSRKGSRATVTSDRSPSGLTKVIPTAQKQRNSPNRYGTGPVDETVQNRRHSRPRSGGPGSDKSLAQKYSQPQKDSTASSSEEERQSYVSKAPTTRSTRSEQLQTLMDEVDKLKNTLNARNSAAQSQSNNESLNATGEQERVPSNSGYNVAPGYYYYIPQGQHGTENQPVNQTTGNTSHGTIPQSVGYTSQLQYDQTYPKVPVNNWQHYNPPSYDYYAQPPDSTAYTYSRVPPSDLYEHRSRRESPSRHRRPKSQYGDSRMAQRGSNRHSSPRRSKREDRGYNSDEYRTERLREYYIPRTERDQNRNYNNSSYPYPYQNANVSASGIHHTAPKPACPTCHGNGHQAQETVVPIPQSQNTYQSPSQGAAQVPSAGPTVSSVPNFPQTQTFLAFSQPAQTPPAANVSYIQPNVQNQVLRPTSQAQPILSHPQQIPAQTATLLTPMPSAGAANASLNTSYVPVQVIPNAAILKITPEKSHKSSKVKGQGHHGKKSETRVRYYIKEYEEEPKVKTANKKKNVYTPRKAAKSERYDSPSEEESDSERSEPDLNESLEHALETARELKKISRTLKSGLKKELSYSSRDIFV